MNKEIIYKYAVGTDISKDDFKACFVGINYSQKLKIKGQRTFKNNKTGFKEFLKWVKKFRKDPGLPIVFNMEATGVYYENLAFFLHQNNLDLSVVLPNKAKNYLEYIGLKSKNDKIDAKGLAQMAAEQSLKLWKPAAKFYYDLRALTRYHQSLQETKTATNNRIHAMKYSANTNKLVMKSLSNQVKLYDKQIKQTLRQIEDHLKTEPEILKKVENICLIKGVKTLTVSVVIAETCGFELFENFKQLISYSGYDVVENQSGKRKGKTKISKKGNSRIRRILFMAAFNVVKYQQTSFYNLYQRTLPRHQIKMKSYVAVQKKVLTTIFALWKNNEAYNNDYHIQNNIQRIGEGVSLSGSSQMEEILTI